MKLQISISTDKTVLELKQAIAEKSDVPADRQRLIYSGEFRRRAVWINCSKICSRKSAEGEHKREMPKLYRTQTEVLLG